MKPHSGRRGKAAGPALKRQILKKQKVGTGFSCFLSSFYNGTIRVLLEITG
jgi:hypothetical protein